MSLVLLSAPWPDGSHHHICEVNSAARASYGDKFLYHQEGFTYYENEVCPTVLALNLKTKPIKAVVMLLLCFPSTKV